MSRLEKMTWDQILNGKANGRVLALKIENKSYTQNFILYHPNEDGSLYCGKMMINPQNDKKYGVYVKVFLNEKREITQEFIEYIPYDEEEKKIIERLSKFDGVTQ